MNRLKEKYQNEVIPALREKFSYKNIMQVPKLEKIVINMAVGDSVGNPKALEAAMADLTLIAGQKPIVTMAIGCKVTLRSTRMYEFLDKFMNVALPRVRDFRGVSNKSFDGRGNYAVGLKEQLIFPEIDYDKIDKIRGMDIVIVTTANTDEEAREFLSLMGMPFEVNK